jgi:hypothetical protein
MAIRHHCAVSAMPTTRRMSSIYPLSTTTSLSAGKHPADDALDEDDDAEELSVGERVRQIAIRNAVCIECFQPMPSGIAAYIGFAPVVS